MLKWTFFLYIMFTCQLLDMKLFVDTDSDIRLVRRLRRDITERGRDIEGVIKQYNKFVKPAFDQYIEPTMRLADIVVPRGACIHLYTFIHCNWKSDLIQVYFVWNCLAVKMNKLQYVFRFPWFQINIINFVFVFVIPLGGGNMVAIDLIVQHVHSQLEEVRKFTLKDLHTYTDFIHPT